MKIQWQQNEILSARNLHFATTFSNDICCKTVKANCKSFREKVLQVDRVFMLNINFESTTVKNNLSFQTILGIEDISDNTLIGLSDRKENVLRKRDLFATIKGSLYQNSFRKLFPAKARDHTCMVMV